MSTISLNTIVSEAINEINVFWEELALKDDLAEVAGKDLRNDSALVSMYSLLLKDQNLLQQYKNSIILSKPELQEKFSSLPLIIFNHLIKLREYFTNQEYELQVVLKDGSVKRVPLNKASSSSLLIFSASQNKILYGIKQIDQIETVQKIAEKKLNNLMAQLFTSKLDLKDKHSSQFLYRKVKIKNKESSYDGIGEFWSNNYERLAAYKANNNAIQHFAVETRKQQHHIYTTNDAFYYNRGHVYEWFLTEQEKQKSTKTVIDISDPVEFVLRNSKENIPFLKAGDYEKGKKAIQVKAWNNQKIISLNQIEKTLATLIGALKDGIISKADIQNSIEKAFVGGENYGLNKNVREAIQKKLNL